MSNILKLIVLGALIVNSCLLALIVFFGAEAVKTNDQKLVIALVLVGNLIVMIMYIRKIAK